MSTDLEPQALTAEEVVTCEWCGAPLDVVLIDETYGSGEFCPEGENVGVTGTSPHRAARSQPVTSDLVAALRELANEAARAVTEPRRFHENEDERQQALGHAVGRARRALSASAISR